MSPRANSPSNWKDARVAVVGLARSGISACTFLQRRGARVTGIDLRPGSDLGPSIEELSASGVETSFGAYPNLAEFDALVLSPGVDPLQDAIATARTRGVRVVPELELGALETKGRLVCITGTKGKSTTTLSLHAMLSEAGLDARAVGNIGEPITAHVEGSNEETVFVIEASSFQLETTERFHPDCAVFLNLFPDHLDRHPSFETYAAAKARIFANQTRDDIAIVNQEDERAMDLAGRTPAHIIPFRPRTIPDASRPGPIAYFENQKAILREKDALQIALFHEADIQIPGFAVRSNLLAAATAASSLGVPDSCIGASVRKFKGVPHTFEKLGEVRGVTFFNDSKATTLESVEVALRSFESPVLAIMGGRLKAGSFASLRDAVGQHVRAIYAIGESRGLVRDALKDACPVHEFSTLEAAVYEAHRAARPGDTILLAPGCSSFDMFRDYAERGDAFKRAFNHLFLQGAA